LIVESSRVVGGLGVSVRIANGERRLRVRRSCAIVGSILVLIAITSFGMPKRAYACLCSQGYPVAASKSNADAIFMGTAVRVAEGAATVGPTREKFKEFTFEVTTIWKGAAQPEINVRVYSSDCAYHFESGKTYLVYAQQLPSPDAALVTTNCARNRELASAGEDLAVLGQGKSIARITPANDLTIPLVAFFAFVVLAVFVTVILWRRLGSKAKYL
jgi:hypothetical protein